jgi:hypothetical protein
VMSRMIVETSGEPTNRAGLGMAHEGQSHCRPTTKVLKFSGCKDPPSLVSANTI